jgi:DNA excision repair protein ERCC-2
VQAGLRAIRTEADRGVVHLLDDRFARPEVSRLFPAWWTVGSGSPHRALPERDDGAEVALAPAPMDDRLSA